jgi:ribonuclease HI
MSPTRASFRISPALEEAFRSYCAQAGLPVDELVEAALVAMMNQAPNRRAELLRQAEGWKSRHDTRSGPRAQASGIDRLLAYTDGGSRGNPGPGAAAVVLVEPDSGTVLHEVGIFLGQVTNNVAEYRALLAALERAGKFGARSVEIRSDSELLVRQMNGQYRVKNEGLKPLFEKALELVKQFDRCTIKHISREANRQADRMANQAMNAGRDVGDVL